VRSGNPWKVCAAPARASAAVGIRGERPQQRVLAVDQDRALKNSPNSIGSMNSQPAISDGIASSSSGITTTAGDLVAGAAGVFVHARLAVEGQNIMRKVYNAVTNTPLSTIA